MCTYAVTHFFQKKQHWQLLTEDMSRHMTFAVTSVSSSLSPSAKFYLERFAELAGV